MCMFATHLRIDYMPSRFRNHSGSGSEMLKATSLFTSLCEVQPVLFSFFRRLETALSDLELAFQACRTSPAQAADFALTIKQYRSQFG